MPWLIARPLSEHIGKLWPRLSHPASRTSAWFFRTWRLYISVTRILLPTAGSILASVGSNSTYWTICDAFKSATILSNATNVSSASLTSSTTFSAKNPCGSSRNPLDRGGRTTRRPRNNNYFNRKEGKHRGSYILIRYESTQLFTLHAIQERHKFEHFWFYILERTL